MRNVVVRTRRRLAAATAGLIALSAAGAASAQTGWAVDRFEPTAAGDLFFAAQFPTYQRYGLGGLRFGVVGDYALAPVVARPAAGSPQGVIDNMLVLHAQVGVSLFDRLGIHLSVPFVLLEDGPTGNAGLAIRAANGAAVGDPRLAVRVRIAGDALRDPISLHLGASAYFGFLGIAPRTSGASDEGFRLRAYAVLAGSAGPLRWSLDGGFHYRPTVVANDTTIGPDVYINAAVGLSALQDRLTIGPELWASTVLEQAFQYAHINAELILGVHYRVADTVLLGLGGGPGLTQGAGTPTFRGLLQLAYSPIERERPAAPPPDTDADGVLDPDDQCVTTPRGDHPDPARLGCPLGDADHDGVLDPDDQCPSEPQGDHPDPARRGCPAGDSDHDGVLDPDDRCVDVPRGDHPDPERAGCPDGDADHDGVRDHDDQCRTEPQGPLPDPARPGCPAPDRDHDMVPDATDHCPDQPGSPSSDPNRNGCPGLVRLESGALRILQPVFFATNRDVILARSFPVLTAVAEALRARTEIHRVSVEGHTDNVGNDERNMDLSQRRAASVVRWLTAHGIDASRLEAHGFGETQPLATNSTAAGRAQNRRVIFRITDPAAPDAAPTPAAAP